MTTSKKKFWNKAAVCSFPKQNERHNISKSYDVKRRKPKGKKYNVRRINTHFKDKYHFRAVVKFPSKYARGQGFKPHYPASIRLRRLKRGIKIGTAMTFVQKKRKKKKKKTKTKLMIQRICFDEEVKS